MLLRSTRILCALCLAAVLAGLPALLPRSTAARERPKPKISLSVFQCPPGMTEATLATVDCEPLTSDVDVDLISIDNTQPKFTFADGQVYGHVVRWEVMPSDAEVDHWGLKQTKLPAGSTAYLLQGESVHLQPAPIYDYRFTTNDSTPQTDLSMYVFSSAAQGVIIPSSTQEQTEPPSEPAPDPEPTHTAIPEVQSEPEQTPPDASGGQTENDPAAPPVATGHALTPTPAEESETIAQSNVALRLAADISAVVVDTLDSGEVVGILDGPIEAGSRLWYKVESSANARGWIEASAFEEASAAPVVEPASASESTDAPAPATIEAAPVFEPGDRAIVADPPLNLRSGPSSESNIVATLEDGQLLTIDAQAGSSGGMTWYAVTLLPDRTQSGYVAGQFLADAGFLRGEEVTVSSAEANVRLQPSTSSDVLATLQTGATASVIEGPTTADGYDWYLLLLEDNRSGWVAGSLLALGSGNEVAANASSSVPVSTGSNAFRPGAWVRVVDPPINLRTGPSAAATAIEALDAGDLLVVLSGPEPDGEYSWYLVDLDGVQGYAAGEFLDGGFLPGEHIRPVGASVYLRTEPGVDSDIVWSLAEHESATVVSPDPLLDGDYLWILVRAPGGETGYVATEFIEPAGSET